MPYKLKTLQGYYDEVWTNGNLDAIPQFLAPDARTRGIMGDMPFAADDLADLIFMIREQLGTIEVTLPVTVEQDDWLSALVEVKSVALSSGDPVHVFGQMIARFDGEKMSEIYSGVDSLLLFEQLGLLPENAMAVMLSGTRLR
mmetsp:Transcript_27438/g.50586  ORF Transcript_27438/g.50586 Transcript_27438/m.50586 type:complete len:143 (-) Transcript_27438:14-442(-)